MSPNLAINAVIGKLAKEDHEVWKSILVALCDPDHSLVVVQQAIWLAKREGARLVGLHVVNEMDLVPPAGTEGVTIWQWRMQEEPWLKGIGTRLLDGFAAECSKVGVPAETRLLIGPVAETISRQGQATDLIVLGRAGEYGHRDGLLDCCPLEGVLRRASRPVLVVTQEPREIGRILVAYDGSPRASAALACAARLADNWRVPLFLVTVAERKVGQQTLREGLEYLRPYHLRVKGLLLEGSPAAMILQACEDENADLVVMGTYCHGQVQEMVVGGTVGRVLKGTHLPVLIGR